MPDHMPLGPDRAGRARAAQPKPPGSAVNVPRWPVCAGEAGHSRMETVRQRLISYGQDTAFEHWNVLMVVHP